MKKTIAAALICTLFSMAQAASAQETTYLAMNPDSRFCVSVIFGNDGRGEYTLTVDDPGYPGRPWADMHLASFTSSERNPVTVPVCFSTAGRKKGDEAFLTFTVKAPEREVTYGYGICVSEHEDLDVVESSENPCTATASHTDLFSASLLQHERYARPGENVAFTLVVSSEFDLFVSLDKESGPRMDISATTVQLPGEESVQISMDAPNETGDYPFSIVLTANDCDYESCEKRVSGVLHVSPSPTTIGGFVFSLSPKSRNVLGTHAATYYIVISNLGEEQTFTVDIEADDALERNFDSAELTIPKNGKKTVEFFVLPKSHEHMIYTIRATAVDEEGIEKTAESVLTVDEPASDAQRAGENDPGLMDDADVFEDNYEDHPELDDWDSFRVLMETPENGDGQEETGEGGSFNWLLIVVMAVIAAVIILFIYKKTKVVKEGGQSYFGYQY